MVFITAHIIIRSRQLTMPLSVLLITKFKLVNLHHISQLSSERCQWIRLSYLSHQSAVKQIKKL
jgi:hypothetical protein